MGFTKRWSCQKGGYCGRSVCSWLPEEEVVEEEVKGEMHGSMDAWKNGGMNVWVYDL